MRPSTLLPLARRSTLAAEVDSAQAQRATAARGQVFVVWDQENLQLRRTTSPGRFVSVIRHLALSPPGRPSEHAELGPTASSLVAIRAYRDLQRDFYHFGTRDGLFNAGVETIDCPHGGKKEVVDKRIAHDLAAFARTTKLPATVMLMSGDRDFGSQLHELASRGFKTVLVADRVDPEYFTSATAGEVYSWEDILDASETSPTPPKFALLPATLDTVTATTSSSSAPALSPTPWEAPPEAAPMLTTTDKEMFGEASSDWRTMERGSKLRIKNYKKTVSDRRSKEAKPDY